MFKKVLATNVTFIIIYFIVYLIMIIPSNKFFIDNRILIYTIVNLIFGTCYAISYRYFYNTQFFKGLITSLLLILIAQLFGFIIYMIKTDGFKFGDTMGTIIFTYYLLYSIVLIAISFTISFFLSKLLKA
jgi:hypothetical protein